VSRRHADRIASFWLTRLRDSPPPKRLNFIYLVNEIVQNSRARRKDDFPNAFSPLMAEATQTAYRSSPPDIQGKIRRVVEVWRSRSVFELPIQAAIEARLDEVDKTKGPGKKTLMGNSLFGSGSSGSGMPKELESLGSLQIAVSKASITTNATTQTADLEYEKLNDPNVTLPSPPVHAARLSALMKSLTNAESSVAESVKARKALIEGLEKILETNRAQLAKDEETYLNLSSRKTSTEAKKREVEDSIMRGMSTSVENSPVNGSPGDRGKSESTAAETERPDYEALTPPPVESLTPTGSPKSSIPAEPVKRELEVEDNPNVHDILATMSGVSRVRSASAQATNGGSVKRRKMSHGAEDFAVSLGGIDGGLGDLDEDVAELLRQESAKAEGI
jgi:regulator of Ty1 transposition protein 103